MTIDFAYGFVAGSALSLITGPAIGLTMYRGLVARVARHSELEKMAQKLQNAREAQDSGRDELPREKAGPSGEVHDLFPPRIGALRHNRFR